MKYCPKCKTEKHDTDFSKSARSKDGLRGWCKKCTNEYNCEREKIKPRDRSAYYKTSLNYNEYKEKYYTEHKEYYLTLNKRYRSTILGRYGMYVRNAKTRNINWNLTLDQFSKLWQQPCYYCGDVIATIGIDRVDNNIGYLEDNIVPCCSHCNMMKRNDSLSDFILKINKIHIKLCKELNT